MGYQVIKQGKTDLKVELGNGEEANIEEGKYCIFSSVVDNIVAFNLDREEVFQYFAEEAIESSRLNIERIFRRLEETDAPYYQFSITWEKALEMARNSDDNCDDEDWVEGGSHG